MRSVLPATCCLSSRFILDVKRLEVRRKRFCSEDLEVQLADIAAQASAYSSLAVVVPCVPWAMADGSQPNGGDRFDLATSSFLVPSYPVPIRSPCRVGMQSQRTSGYDCNWYRL